MKNLTLTRPIVICDTETTGTDPAVDRIIDVCCIRYSPGGGRESLYLRVNPGRPIPEAASKIHGIFDGNVAHLQPFSVFAQEIADFIGDADVAGFCVLFDLKMLAAEFARCRVPFPIAGRAVIDAHAIFAQREPRTLAAAVQRYTGAVHAGAHGAQADAQAAAEVLDGQLATYTDLPQTVPELARAIRGDAVDRGYCAWVIEKGGFLSDVTELVEKAIADDNRAREGLRRGLELAAAQDYVEWAY